MTPYDPDDDNLDFEPEAVAKEFAAEINRYLNESTDALEAEHRKAVMLDVLWASLTNYVYAPDSEMFTRLNPFGTADYDDA